VDIRLGANRLLPRARVHGVTYARTAQGDDVIGEEQLNPTRRRRRRSTRETLREQRGDGIKSDAVRAGLTGGRFRPLSERDLQRIHATALDVLEQIGVGEPTPNIVEAAIPKGAVLSDGGRLCFPRSLMEDLIDGSCKEFTHYAPNPEYDIQIGGDRVHFRTCGEAVNIFDYETREARPSKLVDLYDTARLADRLTNIHAFCQTVVATEHSNDAFVHDTNALYAQLAGTQKALAMSTATAAHIDHFITLLDLFMGREGAFLERPFFNFGGCPIVSPLRFGADNACIHSSPTAGPTTTGRKRASETPTNSPTNEPPRSCRSTTRSTSIRRPTRASASASRSRSSPET